MDIIFEALTEAIDFAANIIADKLAEKVTDKSRSGKIRIITAFILLGIPAIVLLTLAFFVTPKISHILTILCLVSSILLLLLLFMFCVKARSKM
jgi:hypothetical protein